MMKFILFPLALIASPVAAQVGVVDPITLSGGVNIVSDYNSRGISLSDNDIAIQPTVTLTHESGFYVGAWGTNTADTPRYGNIEVDLYGGYGTEIASGTDLDVGLYYYYFPKGDPAVGPSDFLKCWAVFPTPSVRSRCGGNWPIAGIKNRWGRTMSMPMSR
jgi:uncharacterized protein (TIGR02001 family)